MKNHFDKRFARSRFTVNTYVRFVFDFFTTICSSRNPRRIENRVVIYFVYGLMTGRRRRGAEKNPCLCNTDYTPAYENARERIKSHFYAEKKNGNRSVYSDDVGTISTRILRRIEPRACVISRNDDIILYFAKNTHTMCTSPPHDLNASSSTLQV